MSCREHPGLLTQKFAIMETTNHRAQLVYNSMKYYYFYTRPDYRLVWDFIQSPTKQKL